jgi:hypothetical protein
LSSSSFPNALRRVLRVHQRLTGEHAERHLRVNLDDALIGVGEWFDLEDPAPQRKRLLRERLAGARLGDPLRLLIRLRLEDGLRTRREPRIRFGEGALELVSLPRPSTVVPPVAPPPEHSRHLGHACRAQPCGFGLAKSSREAHGVSTRLQIGISLRDTTGEGDTTN